MAEAEGGGGGGEMVSRGDTPCAAADDQDRAR